MSNLQQQQFATPVAIDPSSFMQSTAADIYGRNMCWPMCWPMYPEQLQVRFLLFYCQIILIFNSQRQTRTTAPPLRTLSFRRFTWRPHYSQYSSQLISMSIMDALAGEFYIRLHLENNNISVHSAVETNTDELTPISLTSPSHNLPHLLHLVPKPQKRLTLCS